MDDETLKKIKDIAEEAIEDRKAYRSPIDKMRTDARAFQLIAAALGLKVEEPPKEGSAK